MDMQRWLTTQNSKNIKIRILNCRHGKRDEITQTFGTWLKQAPTEPPRPGAETQSTLHSSHGTWRQKMMKKRQLNVKRGKWRTWMISSTSECGIMWKNPNPKSKKEWQKLKENEVQEEVVIDETKITQTSTLLSL